MFRLFSTEEKHFDSSTKEKRFNRIRPQSFFDRNELRDFFEKMVFIKLNMIFIALISQTETVIIGFVQSSELHFQSFSDHFQKNQCRPKLYKVQMVESQMNVFD